MAQTKVKTDYMGPLARWHRTCLCDVTCEHARKSVWSSICYIPLWSDNIKRFSQLGVPSELSSWFGWILGFLLHSRLDFVAQSFQFSSLSLPTLSSEPGQIILVGLGGTGFLLSCQSDFICFGPLQSFLDPLVFQGERGREDTQSQRVPSYSFSFSSHLALSSWLATLIALPVPHFGCLACTWLALENSGFPDSNRCVLPTHPIQPDFTWQAGRILFNSNQVSGMDKLGHKICPKSSAVKISAFCADFCNFLHFFGKFLLI